MAEFNLINHYFKRRSGNRNDVLLGIGDDAAVLDVSCQQQLVVATDTLVQGIHFLPETDAVAIGYKAKLGTS